MEVLYRKYRPQTLLEIFGQPQVVSYFEKALKNGKVAHAYLFSGPRGLGKTSVARIIAKSLNCLEENKPCLKCPSCQAVLAGNHLDIVEIDAASNRGIDDIRALRETIGLLPQMGKYKIYILDEAHMLTDDACDALLKTLEEPPEHVVFILCTTESYRLPETILSRVLRFDFNAPSEKLLAEYLLGIVKKEELGLEDQAIELLAKKAEGSYRDSLGFLDKVIGSADFSRDKMITKKEAEEILGFVSAEKVEAFLAKLSQKDAFAAIDFLNSLGEIVDFSELMKEVLISLRQQIFEKKRQYFLEDDLLRLISLLLKAQKESRFTDLPQLPLEMAILEFCQTKEQAVNSNVSSPKVPSLTKEAEGPRLPKPPDCSIDLNTFWVKLLEGVKPFNHSIELSLRACQPQKLENGILELSFEYPFHQEQINKETNRHLIEEVASKIASLPIKIKAILSKNKKTIDFQDRAPQDLQKSDNNQKERVTEPSSISKVNNTSNNAPKPSSDPLMRAVRDLGGVLMQ